MADLKRLIATFIDVYRYNARVVPAPSDAGNALQGDTKNDTLIGDNSYFRLKGDN